MGYPYEDLGPEQFERLVVQVARKLFGMGAAGFSTGPDGGRDARFSGTAERYPSAAAPWTGTTVFQAKHTIGTNCHFSDPNFSGDADSAVITKEIPRIKGLADGGMLDNYVLVANRRLGANSEEGIRTRIGSACGIHKEKIALFGIEYLNDVIRQYSDVVGLAQIDPIDMPLKVSSYDIAELILAVSGGLDESVQDAPVVDRTSFDTKNEVNAMSTEFADNLLRRYLPLTTQFDNFLSEPENAASLVRYNAAVDDLQFNVIAKRTDFQSFDHVFNHLMDLLSQRDPVIARNSRLSRALLFHMYWNCDLGEVPEVDPAN